MFQLKGGLYIEKAATDMMVAADTEELMAEGWLRKLFWRRRNSDQLSGIIRSQDVDDQLRISDVNASFAGQDGLEEVDFELTTDLHDQARPHLVRIVMASKIGRM